MREKGFYRNIAVILTVVFIVFIIIVCMCSVSAEAAVEKIVPKENVVNEIIAADLPDSEYVDENHDDSKTDETLATDIITETNKDSVMEEARAADEATATSEAPVTEEFLASDMASEEMIQEALEYYHSYIRKAVASYVDLISFSGISIEELYHKINDAGSDDSEERTASSGIMLLSASLNYASGYFSFYGQTTNLFQVNGYTAFCIDPQLATPAEGVWTSDATIYYASSNMLLAKVLYYGYGGGGDITAAYAAGTDRIAITHAAAAYAYGSPYWNYNMTSTGQSIVLGFLSGVRQQVDLTGGSKYAILHTSDTTQNIGYLISGTKAEAYTYLAAGDLTVQKTDAATGEYLQGTGFTVYGYDTDTHDYTTVVRSEQFTNEMGYTVFDGISVTDSDNGLFLVKETTVPEGYSDEYIPMNDEDAEDYAAYGGRLYIIPSSGVRAYAYRDPSAVKLISENKNELGTFRILQVFDDFYLFDFYDSTITDWNNYAIEVYCDATDDPTGGAMWYDAQQMAAGWFRTAIPADYYYVDGLTGRYISAVMWYKSLSGEVYSAGAGSGYAYAGDRALVSETAVADTGLCVSVYNMVYSAVDYVLRISREMGCPYEYIAFPTYTEDGDESDIVYPDLYPVEGGYDEWNYNFTYMDNAALLATNVYYRKSVSSDVYDGNVLMNHALLSSEKKGAVIADAEEVTSHNLTIRKKIQQADLKEEQGDPVFFFKITCLDGADAGRIYIREISFDSGNYEGEDVTEADEDGYVQQEITLKNISAANYYIEEIGVQRYVLTDVSSETGNITIQQNVLAEGSDYMVIEAEVTADLTETDGKIVFTNRKNNWAGFSGTDLVINSL